MPATLRRTETTEPTAFEVTQDLYSNIESLNISETVRMTRSNQPSNNPRHRHRRIQITPITRDSPQNLLSGETLRQQRTANGDNMRISNTFLSTIAIIERSKVIDKILLYDNKGHEYYWRGDANECENIVVRWKELNAHQIDIGYYEFQSTLCAVYVGTTYLDKMGIINMNFAENGDNVFTICFTEGYKFITEGLIGNNAEIELVYQNLLQHWDQKNES
jgi:hypothetical protein